MKTNNELPKKAAKRFTYSIPGSLLLNQITQPIQIRNISKTGIQFFSSVHIPNNVTIKVTWKDPNLGPIESNLVVVRSIFQVEEKEFPYCYGSKFLNLVNEARKNVNRLVEVTGEMERKNDQALLKGVSLKTVNDVVIHGRAFLRDLIRGSKSTAVIDKFANDLKNYEKDCFGKVDEVSQWLQKLVTQHFHSQILLLVLQQATTPDNINKLIKDKLKSMDILISECNQFLETPAAKNVPSSGGIRESLNRLIYGRVELIERFTKRTGLKIEQIKGTNPEYDTSWKTPGRGGRFPS